MAPERKSRSAKTKGPTGTRTGAQARLVFDPSKMAAAQPDPAPDPGPTGASGAGQAPWSVSRLAARIDGALKAELPKRVRVSGEVSGFNHRTHWYFSLKDAGSIVSCVRFASSARNASYTPADGDQVVVGGAVEYYGPQGRTQLYVQTLDRVGTGTAEQQLAARRDRLREEGLFDPAGKAVLPAFPSRIAVVTSRTGAALQDVIGTFAKRAPWIELRLVDTRVQGPTAASEISRALLSLHEHRQALAIDAVVLTRGGGSAEDLAAFNDEAVVRAVAACAVPVVAAIGHETDTALAELAADERCATPTQAATRLAPDKAALDEHLDRLGARLTNALRARATEGALRAKHAARLLQRAARDAHALGASTGLEQHRRLRIAAQEALGTRRAALHTLAARLSDAAPARTAAARAQRLAALGGRLSTAVQVRLVRAETTQLGARLDRAAQTAAAQHQRRTESLLRELCAVSPLAVLDRGYSVTLGPDGSTLRDPADAPAGTELTTRVAKGTLQSVAKGAPAKPAGSRTVDAPPPTDR